MFLCMMDRREALLLVDRLKRRTRDPEVLTAVRVCPRDGCPRDNPGIPAAGCPVDTAGCDAIHLLPGVRGTSGCRDGEEKKMAPWAPRLMLMSASLGRPRGNPAQVWLLNGTASAGRGTGHGRPILWQLRNSGGAQASPGLRNSDVDC